MLPQIIKTRYINNQIDNNKKKKEPEEMILIQLFCINNIENILSQHKLLKIYGCIKKPLKYAMIKQNSKIK